MVQGQGKVTLLLRASLVLALSEAAVMGILRSVPVTDRPALIILDPLLMAALAAVPLYLLVRADLSKAAKQEALDHKLHVIVSELWSASLHTLDTEDLLRRILLEILENSPISLRRKGAIFLREGNSLRLRTQVGFQQEQLRLCAEVRTGSCLCGKVLQTGEAVFAGDVDERHDIHSQDLVPHGHYCLPIKSADRVIGVLTLYLEAGHRRDADEERFLSSVCAIIARIIEGKRLQLSLFQAQKLESLNRFAAGIAHDLNNILGVISGYCSTAKTCLPAGSDAAGDLTSICDAAERGAALTRQLRLFSRQEREQERTLDIGPLVADSANLLRRLVGGGVEVRLDLAPGPLPVKCGRAQIEQLLLNLAANARDAMPSGGTLSISTARGSRCFAPARGPLPTALLTVTDTGQGMNEETTGRLFEPFFTTKTEGKGTGLGLAIVQGIVLGHGGEIQVRSRPGHGTSFEICLPLAAASEG